MFCVTSNPFSVRAEQNRRIPFSSRSIDPAGEVKPMLVVALSRGDAREKGKAIITTKAKTCGHDTRVRAYVSFMFGINGHEFRFAIEGLSLPEFQRRCS